MSEEKNELEEQTSFLDEQEKLLQGIKNKENPIEPEKEESDSSIEDMIKGFENITKKDETRESDEGDEVVEDEEPVEVLESVEDAKTTITEKKEIPQKTPAKPTPSQKPKQVAPKKKKSSSKKKKKKKHTTQRDAEAAARHAELLKQQKLKQQENVEVLAFIKKYAKPTLITVVSICLLILANGFFKSTRLKKENRADIALTHAKSDSDFETIVKDYASTPSAPVALMELARRKFNQNQIDEADALYAKFIKKYGSHKLVAQAKLNQISCKQAKGQFDVAQKEYDEFIKNNPDSYLIPSAMLGKARCLEALNQLDQAQIVYEDIMANYANTSWAQAAQTTLMIMKKK